jgi:hypothetical protein
MKKRALLIVTCCALVGAFLVMPRTTLAGTSSITFGDSGSDLAYELYVASGSTHGQSVEASGGNPSHYLYGNPTTADSGCAGSSNSSDAALQIYWYGTYISSVSSDTWATSGRIRSLIISYSTDGVNFTPLYTSYTGSGWHTSTVSIGIAGVVALKINVHHCGVNATAVGMDNVIVTYGSDSPTNTPTATATLDPSLTSWSKPLRGGEQLFNDISFHPGKMSITELNGLYFLEDTSGIGWGNFIFNIGFSNSSINNVFAVHSGTVTSVVSISRCLVPAPGYPNLCQIYWDTAGITLYFISIDYVYIVTESLDDGRLIRYVVLSPTVQTGDHLTAGCLIGTTLPLRGIAGGDLGDGVIILQALESDETTTFDISSLLVNEPSGIACAAQTPVGSCRLTANAIFAPDAGAWQPSVGSQTVPYALGGGMTFPSSIEQTLNLDYAAQYRITYIYEIEPGAPSQSIMIHLGTTGVPRTLNGSPGQNITEVIDAGFYTADRDDGLYTLRILAESGMADQTTMKFICVEDAAANPIADAEGCIVLEPTFGSAGLNSPWWDIASSPEAIITPGMAELPDGADIQSYPFLLNPADGGAQDYDLKITYRRKGVTEAGKSVGLDWNSDISNDGSFAAVYTQNWVEATATITISSPTLEQIEITAVGSDSQQIAQISKVCVTPHGGGIPPGYYPPAPFQGGCRYCVYTPTGDVATDISEFQQWLACQLFQLWECQAKILLRYIWQALVNILTLLGYFRLWLSSTIIGLVTWGNGNLLAFIRWLDSELINLGIRFSNALTSTITVTNITGGGGSTLGDILMALITGLTGIVSQIISQIGAPIIALLQQLVGGIFDLIRLVLLIGYSFIAVLTGGILGILANIFGLLLGMFQSILNGIASAATVITPEWLPNCIDPGASGVSLVVCTGIYGIESGLAVGPFALIVPIGIGLAAFNLLIWGIGRLRTALQ